MSETTATTPQKARLQALEVLIDQGLEFAEVKAAFAARQDERAAAYVEAAREVWHEDGEIEVDDDTITSGSDDDGDYVLAWVWVSDDQARKYGDLSEDDDESED